MSEHQNTLIVKCTVGFDGVNDERCNQALTVAATAASAGIAVSLWLTAEASWLAVPGRAEQHELPHASNPAELLATVLETGQVTLCGQCALRRELTGNTILPNIRIAGAAAFVAESMRSDARVLVY